MSVLSPLRSSTFYQGSIIIADGFVGDKDVTLNPAIDPAKVVNLIPLKVNANTSGGPMTFGRCSTGNMGYSYVHIASATTFRFKSVGLQAGSGSQTIDYAFQVVEAR